MIVQPTVRQPPYLRLKILIRPLNKVLPVMLSNQM